MEENMQSEAEERELYSDGQVKLSDRRISCNYITIPIGDIECVGTNLRIGLFNLSIGCLILSCVPFYWYDLLYMNVIGAVLVVLSIIFVCKIYLSYVGLYVTAGHHKIRLLSAPMDKRDYIYNISEKLAGIVIEEKHLENKKKEIESALPSYIDPSMTMLLRMAQNQQEKDGGTAGAAPATTEETPVKPKESAESKPEEAKEEAKAEPSGEKAPEEGKKEES